MTTITIHTMDGKNYILDYDKVGIYSHYIYGDAKNEKDVFVGAITNEIFENYDIEAEMKLAIFKKDCEEELNEYNTININDKLFCLLAYDEEFTKMMETKFKPAISKYIKLNLYSDFDNQIEESDEDEIRYEEIDYESEFNSYKHIWLNKQMGYTQEIIDDINSISNDEKAILYEKKNRFNLDAFISKIIEEDNILDYDEYLTHTH